MSKSQIHQRFGFGARYENLRRDLKLQIVELDAAGEVGQGVAGSAAADKGLVVGSVAPRLQGGQRP
jgi:hypothetical protein